jgi:hypothetical protein
LIHRPFMTHPTILGVVVDPKVTSILAYINTAQI